MRNERHGGLLAKAWKWLWIVFVLCLVLPLRYTALKLGLLGSGAALWVLALILFRERRSVQLTCALIALLAVGFGAFLLSPGHRYDHATLRREYVRMLLTYRGTPYIWGGGSHLGIDCSGLVQRALIDAELVQSARTANPNLARQALSLWWHSRSARAIGQGYRNETDLVMEQPSLDQADDALIQPGDMAVMTDGVHVLAYLGHDTWIEADPRPMRVVLAHRPRPHDPYFEMPVRIMRWKVMDQHETAS